MNKHIDFILEKITIIGFFLFILFVFESADGRNINSINKSNTIEHVLKVENYVTLVTPISFSSINNLLVTCEILTLNDNNKSNLVIICSNIKANHLLQISKERFSKIKPKIFNSICFHIRTSLNNEVIRPIS